MQNPDRRMTPAERRRYLKSAVEYNQTLAMVAESLSMRADFDPQVKRWSHFVGKQHREHETKFRKILARFENGPKPASDKQLTNDEESKTKQETNA